MAELPSTKLSQMGPGEPLRLTVEVVVLRDRIDTHESLAEKHGDYSLADVESYRPTPEEEQRRAERRRTLVARVVRDLT